MIVQTLSIVIPTRGCVNKCKFCVSKTHCDSYINKMDDPYFISDLKRRLNYAVLQNIDTIILTGTGEALQNIPYLSTLDVILKNMNNPFPIIELQTSGVMLTDENLKFLRDMGVSTISISVSNLFDDDRNMEIIGVHPTLQFKLMDICKKIIDLGFNIRLSLNMTNDYVKIYPIQYFDKAKELGATQITFRELYNSNNNTNEDKWVIKNKLRSDQMDFIKKFILENGRSLYKLPFGATVYSINGISTVVDSDCMNIKKDVNDEVLKYLILRENGKLYTHWDDEGSLRF